MYFHVIPCTSNVFRMAHLSHLLLSPLRQIPFGIGQIGKAFRNEITPRNFVFRSREFEQMELEYFIPPGDDIWSQVINQHWRIAVCLNLKI